MHTGPLSLTQSLGHAGGLGYLPAYQYVVATAAALTAIPDAVAGNSLADGTFAAVLIAGGQKQIWVLDTTSTQPIDGVTCVATDSGVGRWIMMTAQPNTTANDFYTDLIYRPAGVAVPGLVYTAWTGPNSIESVLTADQGLTRIWLDNTGVLGAMTITPTAASDGKGMAELHSATGKQITLTLTPESTLKSIGLFQDVIIESAVDFSAPGVHNFALTFAEKTNVRFDNSIVRPTGAATSGVMIGVLATTEGGTTLQIFLDNKSQLIGTHGPLYALQVAGGATPATCEIHATRDAVIDGTAIFLEAATLLAVHRDASVDPFAVSGTGLVSVTLCDKASNEFYDDTLTAPAIVPVPVAGGASQQQAFDALKPFILPFVDADLVAGILTVTHNKGVQYLSRIVVSDGSNAQIIPDGVVFTDANTVTIDMTSFGTLVGTYHASVGI
jgi:hypothetical protein